MAQRFRQSGKEKLIALVLSDFDPEGEDIAHSFAQSMRDDFGIEQVVGIKVCLRHEQVLDHDLPVNFDAKKKSSRYAKFAAKYGDWVHEVEALLVEERVRLLRAAIDSALDVDAFNREVDAEKEDAAHLAEVRKRVLGAISGCFSVDEEGGGR
jgi:hypothetical protein